MIEPKKSLAELIEYKSKISKEAEENLGELSDEDFELLEINELLLKNKVDTIALKFQAIDGHIEATKKQLEYLKKTKERAEEFVKTLVSNTETKRVDGNAFAIKVQNNGGQAALETEEELIPDAYKFIDVNLSRPATIESLLLWTQAILKKELTVDQLSQLSDDERKIIANSIRFNINVSGTIEEKTYYSSLILEKEDVLEEDIKSLQASGQIQVLVDSKKLRQDLKDKEIPGAKLKRGTHLRIESGKAKSKEIKQPSVLVEG